MSIDKVFFMAQRLGLSSQDNTKPRGLFDPTFVDDDAYLQYWRNNLFLRNTSRKRGFSLSERFHCG